ncbi:MAG: acyl carrier protein [Sphingomonadales bacterium]
MSHFLDMRQRVLAAIAENPVVGPNSPEILERMTDPARDCAFEELGFDSLARMEFCIFFEAEYGITITHGDVESHPSINAMADWLARTAG